MAKKRPSFSIADYCISNVCRSFSGESFGHMLCTYDRDPSYGGGSQNVFLDEYGNVSSKEELAQILGVTPRTVVAVYERFCFNHKRVFDEYLKKKLGTNLFKLDCGEPTSAVVLGELYGVRPSTVSATYSSFGGDYAKANKKLSENKARRELLT